MTNYAMIRELLNDMGIECGTTQDAGLPDSYARWIGVIEGRYTYATSSKEALAEYAKDMDMQVGLEVDQVYLSDEFWEIVNEAA